MITIDLSPRGDRIFLVSGRPTPGLGKRVPGAAFSKVGGPHWSIPLNMESCRTLREIFGAELKIGRRLGDWARGAIAREQAMLSLGRAADATLLRVPDVSQVLAKAMGSRTYQRVGARWVAESAKHGGVLIADQPGLGKTLEVIGGVIESGVPGPYLVVCPKTAVQPVWAREVPRWWPGSTVVTVPDGRAKRDSILNGLLVVDGAPLTGQPGGFTLDTTWVVVHPEMLRTRSWWACGRCGGKTGWKAGPKPAQLDCGHEAFESKRVDEHEFPQLFGIAWGAAIVDESDRSLVRKTGTPTQVRRGAELLPTRAEGLRVAMSGTPFRSKPHLLWGTLNWLRPADYPAFWRWAETFYDVEAGYAGSRDIGGLRPERAADLDRQLSQIMLRRTKAEVAPDLPAKTYGGTPLVDGDEGSPVGVWLPMDAKQRAVYDKMAAESAAAIEGGTLNAIGILAELTRLKQFATSAGRLQNVRRAVRGDVEAMMRRGAARRGKSLGPDPFYEDGQEFVPSLPSNKFDWLVEHLQELGYPDDPQTKVVIVSQFTSVLKMFAEAFRSLYKGNYAGWGGSLMMTGDVTARRRTEAVDRFNMPVGSESEHLMLLQTRTGGVALTLDTADEMVFLDETWIPDDQEQAEDRIHRVSNPRPVTYWYLRSMDSIEEHIAAVNAERRENAHEVLDGRRGVEMARRLLGRS